MAVLTVPAELENLSLIRNHVKMACNNAGLSEEESYALILAVDELATNIIMYGYTEPVNQGEVTLTTDMDDAKLTVTLEDRGTPFDPSRRSMPGPNQLHKPLEEREIGGLGIFLALQNVDEYHYERQGDLNRSILTLHRQ